jgi:hypothetical protein
MELARRRGLRRCWHGAIQCLGRRAQENLGARDSELDKNEKAEFAATEMQKGDRRLPVMAGLVHRCAKARRSSNGYAIHVLLC